MTDPRTALEEEMLDAFNDCMSAMSKAVRSAWNRNQATTAMYLEIAATRRDKLESALAAACIKAKEAGE